MKTKIWYIISTIILIIITCTWTDFLLWTSTIKQGDEQITKLYIYMLLYIIGFIDLFLCILSLIKFCLI